MTGTPLLHSDIATSPTPGIGRGAVRRGPFRRRRRPHNLTLYLSFVWIAILILVSLTVQWLPLHSPTTTVGTINLGPNFGREFLGTDAIGRSMLSRLAYGTRVSMGISLLSTLIAMTIGGLLGLATAYFRGVVTEVVDIITNSVLAIPSLLLLLALMLALRPSLVNLIAALSLIFIPAFMRLTRANAQSQLHRDYVLAARAMGASGARLMFREVVPNTILPLLSYAALVVPGIVVTEGSLSFLGFGVQPPTPSWGGMIAQGQASMSVAPAPAIVPCVVLFLTVFSLTALGDYLRVCFDVRDAQL
jgi:peptide/nickel transport system permease protein